MKRKLFILYIIFGVVAGSLSSCNKRYGHVQKVRVGSHTVAKKENPPQKTPAPALPLQIAAPSLLPQYTVQNTPVKPPTYPVRALPKMVKSQPMQRLASTPANAPKTPTDSLNNKPPAIEDIELEKSNYLEILYLSIIFSFIYIMLIILVLGFLAITFGMLGPGFGGLAVSELIFFMYAFSISLLPPFYFIIRQVNRLRKKIPVNYGGKWYTVGELEEMSPHIRAQRNLNTIKAWVFLLPIVFVMALIPNFNLLIIGYVITLLYLIAKAIRLYIKTLFQKI